jgi:hypothetical protein
LPGVVFDEPVHEQSDDAATDVYGWADRFPVFQAATLDEIVNALTRSFAIHARADQGVAQLDPAAAASMRNRAE